MFFLFLGAREPFDSPQLENVAHALHIVQLRYPTMSLGQLSTLLRVGLVPDREGQFVSVSDVVAHAPGQKYPTIARQIDQLCDGTESRPGLRLLEKQSDPKDRRNRYVAVSERGKNLLYELDLVLAPEIVQTIGQPRSAEA
ncbi:hypothetical protein NIM87_16105 [Devosia sp. XJ19-1]|uniref:Uncharacterized protein n=1 Tax=Devosia ureilytica TaxID=2952754 RepID=A0A9Q4FTP8_9HYPH|nr:hypothetical protein [Devosia ureilytica]MCP8885032.1 hypothetical protein [Devosia ureilytica]MCP8888457.1 hypothetical protein [Devosia ureilytica]